MAEYITKEAAIEAFEWGDADVIEDYGDGCDFGFSRGAIKSGINSIPAADVAPVVRCKNCKHKGWVQEPCHGKSVDYCKVWDCTLRDLESTFCSYGERKDGRTE